MFCMLDAVMSFCKLELCFQAAYLLSMAECRRHLAPSLVSKHCCKGCKVRPWSSNIRKDGLL